MRSLYVQRFLALTTFFASFRAVQKDCNCPQILAGNLSVTSAPCDG